MGESFGVQVVAESLGEWLYESGRHLTRFSGGVVITDLSRMQEKFGYAPITDEDKAKIFGLNSAKLYGVNVEETRQQIANDRMTHLKEVYLAEGGSPSNNIYGWVLG